MRRQRNAIALEEVAGNASHLHLIRYHKISKK